MVALAIVAWLSVRPVSSNDLKQAVDWLTANPGMIV